MARHEFAPIKTLPGWMPAVILGVCSLLFAFVWLNANLLPTPLTFADEPLHVDEFIAERAQNITAHLADLGPKVPGSAANRLARDMLLQQIADIRALAHPAHRIEVDVQTATGSFPIGNMISYYAGIQNVIVRLSPAANASQPQSALLVNSHFDSVPISDGASDATFMVAVMLETLRALSSSYVTHRHAIVFLFNGAEENGLQASHPFITAHEWRHNVRTFVNLDAAGAGGRDMLFQVAPGAGWLLRAYAANAPHVKANVLGEELFQSGLVPSDTDFRIFRDFGRLPGVDMALTDNGYVYHTRYDRPEIVPLGSFQNTGDNVLRLTRALANCDELDALPAADDSVVYFDVLGWFVLAYGTTTALVVNLCVAAGVLIVVLLTLNSFASKSETSYLVLLAELGLIVAVQLLTVGLAAGLVVLAAFVYDAAGRALFWYSNTWLTVGLYGAPLLLGLLAGPAVYLLVYRRRLRRSLNDHKNIDLIMLVIRRSYHVQLFLHAHAVVLVLALLVLTAMQVRSAYLLVFGLAFYGAFALLAYLARLHVHDTRWVYVHLLGQVVPFMFYAGLMLQLVGPLVPMQGRSGTAANPEFLIGGGIFACGLLAVGFLVPVVCFVRRPMWWLAGVALFWLVAAGALITPLAFPYRERVSEQRFWIYHTDRTIHTLNGTEVLNDSGYFLLGMDRNSVRFISDSVPEVQNATTTAAFCDDYLYCGLPLYTTRMMHQAADSVWVPTNHSSHVASGAVRPTLKLLSSELLFGDTRRYTFELTGPDHMNIYLSPADENRLVGWSFADGTIVENTPWHGRPTHFVFLGWGDDQTQSHSLQFTIDIQNKSRLGSAVSFDIAIAGHYVHHRDLLSDDFKAFVATFPPWAHVTPWVSSYDSWQY